MRIWKSRLLLPLLLATAVHAHSLPSRRSTPAGAQESSNFTYRSCASEVRLVFFATDEDDRPVEVLQQDDFAVIDDEVVIREFRSFTRSAPSKLDVTVLMDFSESVLPQLQQETTNVLHLIALWPWSPGDKLSVLSFNGTEAHVICAGTCRSSFTADQFGSLRLGGSTPLFDALEIATNELVRRSQPEIWPVIILFSDGEDTISKASFQGALEKILAGGVQVYAIDIGRPGQLSSGTATLQGIADDSGGRYLRISEGAAKIFNDVIADLHSARVVAYALPVSSSDFHSIRILPTRNLNLQFRSRRGYYRHSGNAY